MVEHEAERTLGINKRRCVALQCAGLPRTTLSLRRATAESPLCSRESFHKGHRFVAFSELTDVTVQYQPEPQENGGKRAHIALGIFFFSQECGDALPAGHVVPSSAHGPLLFQGLCREKQTPRLRGRGRGDGRERRYVRLSVSSVRASGVEPTKRMTPFPRKGTFCRGLGRLLVEAFF